MEEVRTKVEKDVFWINNVVSIGSRGYIHRLIHVQWDKEKIVISPILINAE